jgi:hypothetical protein
MGRQVGFEALAVSSSAVTFTASTGASPTTPANPLARLLTCVVEGGDIRWRADGTSPTATVGSLVRNGQSFILRGESNIKNLEMIRTETDATVSGASFSDINDFLQAPSGGNVASVPAASGVKMARGTIANSVDRTTMATPTSGKKIRLISLCVSWDSTTGTAMECYFGSGANITSNAGREVAESNMDKDAALGTYTMVWPDGAGPIGLVDNTLSGRSNTAVSSTNMNFYSVYREE